MRNLSIFLIIIINNVLWWLIQQLLELLCLYTVGHCWVTDTMTKDTKHHLGCLSLLSLHSLPSVFFSINGKKINNLFIFSQQLETLATNSCHS